MSYHTVKGQKRSDPPGCTNYINLYFKIYTEYKPLDNGDNTEVNIIGGFINPKEIGIFALDLEYDTGKSKISDLEAFNTSPGCPISSSALKKWA